MCTPGHAFARHPYGAITNAVREMRPFAVLFEILPEN